MSHELAAPQDTGQLRSDDPALTAPGALDQRVIDLPRALHRISLTINRASNIRRALPTIAQSIATELDLRAVSFGIAPDGWVARWSLEDDDFVLADPNLPNPHSMPQLSAAGSAFNGFEVDGDAAGDCCACLPIRACGARIGVMLSTAKRGDRIDGPRIEALEMAVELVAAGFERDLQPGEPSPAASQQITRLLATLEMLATLPAIDQAVQPLLAEIAALFDARAATLMITDSAHLECYSSDQPGDANQEAYADLLTAPFVRRALGTLRAQEGEVVRCADGGTTRTGALAVPLVIGGQAVGVLALELAESRTFSATERELAVTIGRHLAVSIERERRMRSYSRHNHLLALVERVTASIARATSADDLFSRMAREVRRSFGYDCSIAMIEDNRLVFLALELDAPHQLPDWVQEGLPLEIGIMGRVARTGQPAFVPDVSEDPAFLDTGRGTTSEIAVPIRVGDEVVGVINVESGPGKPLEHLDFEIMLIIANHIGIALNNRQLIASERESRQAIEAVQRVSTIVAETLDPDESLRRIADTLGEVMGYPIVNLAIIEDDMLLIKASYGERVDEIPHSISIHQGIVGRVARTGQPVFVENVLDDPDYIQVRPDLTCEICVPIRCNGEIAGVLNVEGTAERPLTERDLHLLTTFAEHAGVLLNNAMAYAELSREATLDPMTGVPNLRYFQQQLQVELEHARREGTALSLAVIDMDYLKNVNDSYGHLVGDQVLRELARRLQAQLRGMDLLARYAGDEFVVILPGVDEGQARDIARRLVAAVRRTPIILPEIPPLHLSVSIGVATYPDDAGSSNDLLRAADMAMYVAKENGKNRVSTARQSARVRQRSER